MFFFRILNLLVSVRIQFISIHSIHFHGFKVRIKKILIHFNPFSFTRTSFQVILRTGEKLKS